jgi:peptidoglycan/xylan/chitin deacetylase (PgdA/CDA1 family)
VARSRSKPSRPGEKPRVHRSWPSPALGHSTSGQPEVLFTFDDGPGGELTAKVLDTLKAHDVKAIFFLVGDRITKSGSRARVSALMQRVLDEHHAIGNHTVDHKDLCLKRNAGRVDMEIDDAAHSIADVTHMDVVFFRAPFGVRCPILEDALNARGLHHTHWDIDAQEWRTHDAVRTQNFIIHEINRLSDDERAVVLIHDIHVETVKALPGILDFVDAENARRRAVGRKEIRVLGPSDIAVERLVPGVLQAGSAVTDFLPSVQSRLMGPLAQLSGQAAKIDL